MPVKEEDENKENKAAAAGQQVNGGAGSSESQDSAEKDAKTEDADGSQDDILKLDATAEVDEFSKFLNDFEDELLTEKKTEKAVTATAATDETVAKVAPAADTVPPTGAQKRPRLDTERKVVEGKRLRKKIKPARVERTPSMSPEGGRPQRRQSPLRVSPFNRSPQRNGRGTRSPGDRRAPELSRLDPRGPTWDAAGRQNRRLEDRRGLEDRRPEDRRPEDRCGPEDRRLGDKRGLEERRPAEGRRGLLEDRRPGGGLLAQRTDRPGSQPTDRKSQEFNQAVEKETEEERAERERKEYEERLARLPSPDRHRLEARRQKFQNKGEVKADKPVKISLKSANEEREELSIGTKRTEQPARRQDLARLDSEEGLNLDISDTLDMFSEEPPPLKVAPVTDLRVRLHKKMKMKEMAEVKVGQHQQQQQQPPPVGQPLELMSQSAKERLKRAREPDEERVGPRRAVVEDEEEEDILGPVEPSQKRKVVPPGSRNLARGSEDDGSPSPPPRARMASGENRRVLMVKESTSVSPTAAEFCIVAKASPRKSGLKESLNLRLGEKMEPLEDIKKFEFTEEEILQEMARQKEKKMQREARLREKMERRAKRDEERARKAEEKAKRAEERLKKKTKKKKTTATTEKKRRSSSELSEADVPTAGPGHGGSDSDEELFKFFEDNHQPRTSQASSAGKRVSSEKLRRSSGDSGGRLSRISRLTDSPDLILGGRLGAKVKVKPEKKKAKKEKLSLELAGEDSEADIVEKMKKKNAKRMKRLKEIEQDKLLYA